MLMMTEVCNITEKLAESEDDHKNNNRCGVGGGK